jgi:hypothetical protein
MNTAKTLVRISQAVQYVFSTIQTKLDAILLETVQIINGFMVTGQGHILPYIFPLEAFSERANNRTVGLYYHSSAI